MYSGARILLSQSKEFARKYAFARLADLFVKRLVFLLATCSNTSHSQNKRVPRPQPTWRTLFLLSINCKKKQDGFILLWKTIYSESVSSA